MCIAAISFFPRCVAVGTIPRGAETLCGSEGQKRIALVVGRLFWQGCWRGPCLFGWLLGRGCSSGRRCLPACAAHRTWLRAGLVACWQESHCGFCAAAAIRSECTFVMQSSVSLWLSVGIPALWPNSFRNVPGQSPSSKPQSKRVDLSNRLPRISMGQGSSLGKMCN